MQCPSCGATIRDNAVFCSSCGARVTTQTISTPKPPPAEDSWDTSSRTVGPTDGSWAEPGAGMGAAGGGRAGPPPRPRGFGLGGRRMGPAGSAGVNMNQVTGRLARLLRLDTSVFAEMRDDPAALVPSLAAVAVSVFLMALGGWLWFELEAGEFFESGETFVRSVIFGTIFAVALWVAWVWLASWILSQVSKQRIDWIAQLRGLGFAMLPVAIGLLMSIDLFRTALGVGSIAAAAMLMQVALQETTDAPPGQVFLANLAGLGLWLLALGFLSVDDARLGPGIFSVPSFGIPNFGDLFG